MAHLSHVHLPVPDLARSLAFYTDQLGWEVGFVGTTMAEFPAVGLVLDQENGFQPSAVSVTVGVGVDDVDRAFADLEGRGCAMADPPVDRSWGVRNFYVTDPDGYVIEFEQPRSSAL